EVDAVVGTGELDAILDAAGLSTPSESAQQAASPFNILVSRAPSSVHQHSHPTEAGPQLAAEAEQVTRSDSPNAKFRPEGDHRERQGRFSRAAWHGATAALPEYLYTEDTPRILSTPRASAYIKIAEGCDHPCSFCIIPQLRGKFRSRRVESII